VSGPADGPSEDGSPREDEIQVFSDGSGLGGKVGAATVMYKRGQGPKILQFSMGTLAEHTVFEVEAVGVILVLHMLKSERGVRRAVVQLDNQAVLGVLVIHKPKPAQYLIDEILSQAEELWWCARDLAYGLEIGWVKGHSGVEGNKRVDKEAKEAVKGHSSQPRNLQKILSAGPLPESLSARRQAFDESLMER